MLSVTDVQNIYWYASLDSGLSLILWKDSQSNTLYLIFYVFFSDKAVHYVKYKGSRILDIGPSETRATNITMACPFRYIAAFWNYFIHLFNYHCIVGYIEIVHFQAWTSLKFDLCKWIRNYMKIYRNHIHLSRFQWLNIILKSRIKSISNGIRRLTCHLWQFGDAKCILGRMELCPRVSFEGYSTKIGWYSYMDSIRD